MRHHLFNFVCRLSWSPAVISANFYSSNVRRSLKSQKNSPKTCYFGFQCRSRSSMLVQPKRSSAVLVMTCTKCVPIMNYVVRKRGRETVFHNAVTSELQDCRSLQYHILVMSSSVTNQCSHIHNYTSSDCIRNAKFYIDQ